MRRSLSVALLLCGCASSPPDAARIEARAELGEARVVRVDGARVLAGNVVHVPPGRHRLRVFCEFNPGIMIGDARRVQREVTVELAPRARYRLEARMTPEPCTVTLVREQR